MQVRDVEPEISTPIIVRSGTRGVDPFFVKLVQQDLVADLTLKNEAASAALLQYEVRSPKIFKVNAPLRFVKVA